MQSRPITAIMNPAVIELPPQAALDEAMTLMQEKRISAIVISEGGVTQGILTEHDLVRTVSHHRETASLSCADLMHSPVITAGTTISDLDAFHLMTVEHIRHLLICHADGSTAGIVTESDLSQNLSMEYMLKLKEVGSVMSPHCLTMCAQDSVGEAAERMLVAQQGAVVVVGENKQPLGVVTERDIVRLRREHAEPWQLPLGEVMVSPVVSVLVDTPLTTAVELMRDSHIRRLVVVDNNSRVRGMLSQHEVIQGLENDYVQALRKVINEQKEQLDENSERLNEKALLDTIFTTVDDTLLIATDEQLHICYWNPTTEQVLGVAPEVLRGCLLRECLSAIDPQNLLCEHLYPGLPFEGGEYNLHIDGHDYCFDIALMPLHNGNGMANGYLFRARDISHDKAAQVTLKRSEELLRQAEAVTGIGSWELDLNHDRLEWSDGIFDIFELDKKSFGASYETFVGLIHPDDRQRVDQAFRESIKQRTPYEIEHRLKMADGRIKHVLERGRTFYDEEGRPLRTIGTVQDISERYRSLEALRRSEQRFRDLFDTVSDMIFIHDAETMAIVDVNDKVCEAYGYGREELLQMSLNDLSAGYTPYTQAEAMSHLQAALAGTPQSFEWLARRADGELFWIEINLRLVSLANTRQLLVTAHDINDRKQAENRMQRLTWALRALGKSNSAMVQADSESELLQQVCDAITSHNAYALAWVGLKVLDEAHGVDIAASSGDAGAYMDGFKVSWGDDPLGRGPAGEAIKQDRTQVSNDMLSEDRFAPWKARARDNGLASILTTPLHRYGEDIGVLAVYSRFRDAFGSEEIRLFEQLADDLSYGLASRRTQQAFEESQREQARQAAQLEKVLEDAIGALASTLEKRDPYTAGHEQRVADIAVAIGREMGLEEERLRGMHLAGLVHDIGKVQIPAELLSKPTRLSPIEYQLIQTHSEAGYEILKGLEFPWPIADIVHQHHERIDGSGYPLGLNGEQMLQESRVLAVADVVEAMSSHRPYRPAIGVDIALAEIERQRGSTLDAEAVDACLRLFRDKDYTLPS